MSEDNIVLFHTWHLYIENRSKNPRSPEPPDQAGQYNVINETNDVTMGACFVDKVPRKLWEIQMTPGPGQYEPFREKLESGGANVLYCNKKEEFYIVDSYYQTKGGCRSIFKSGSKKIVTTINDNPGPGQYQITSESSKNRQGGFRWEKPTRLTKYLYEQTIKPSKCLYQMAPNQSKSQDKLVRQIHRADKSKQQKPKNQIKYNYKSIFSSKLQREFLSRPQTSIGVGPGSYNIGESYSNIDRKSYHCKTSTACSNLEVNTPINEMPKDNIGPGSYQIEVSSFRRPQTSHSRGIACFGSKQSRFQGRRSFNGSKVCSPGPQSYFKPNNKQNKNQNKNQNTKKVAFNSCAKKSQGFFFVKSSGNFTQVSPCSYRPRNDFNELLKKNYIKGTIGRFGSTVQRFKQPQKEQSKELNAPIFEIQKTNQSHQRAKVNKNNFKRIKKPHKQVPKPQKDEDQRPLCYDTYSRTISTKYFKKCQKDAPFLIASQRFATKSPNYQQAVIAQILQEQNNSIGVNGQRDIKQSKKRKGKIVPQNSSVLKKYHKIKCEWQDEKPEKQNDALLGPQTYNPQFQSKKSYNVLFRE